MIRKLFSTLFLLALGGALTYFGLGYHYVQTGEEMLVVPKTEMGFTDTYADISDWSLSEFREHPELVQALIEDGHGDVIPDQLTDKLRDALDNLFGGDEPDRNTGRTGTGDNPR